MQERLARQAADEILTRDIRSFPAGVLRGGLIEFAWPCGANHKVDTLPELPLKVRLGTSELWESEYMSLELSDWKAILDQPKNLGLKAGEGTGVSEALREVAAKQTAYENDPQEDNNHKLWNALADLERVCAKMVKKHKTLFKSACEYLDRRVLVAAESRKEEVRAELDAMKAKKNGKQALKQLMADSIRDLRGTLKPEQAWLLVSNFKESFARSSEALPELAKAAAKVRRFELPPRDDFLPVVVRSEGEQRVEYPEAMEGHHLKRNFAKLLQEVQPDIAGL